MRSKLFVPGSRPELFAKALQSDADAVSIDLEDSVTEEKKSEARENVAAFLKSPAALSSPKTLIVRTNAWGSPHFTADLQALCLPALAMVNVPKIESAEDIRTIVLGLESVEALTENPPRPSLLATIETPRGLRQAAEIALAHPRVAGLQLGLADLFEGARIHRHDPANIHAAMFALRMAAAEAKVFAYDAAFPRVNDLEGFRTEAQMAHRLGFWGKSCIHPKQVAVANDVFRPSEEEVRQAQQVLEAYEQHRAQGRGAFVWEGQMIDAAFVARAQTVMQRAKSLGVLP